MNRLWHWLRDQTKPILPLSKRLDNLAQSARFTAVRTASEYDKGYYSGRADALNEAANIIRQKERW